MNANELADALEGAKLVFLRLNKMLRQQQAEIEALKTENSHLKYEISSGAWNPAELTDEEIHQAITRGFGRDGFLSNGIFLEIKELLKKAQNKRYSQLC
jgi:hypothetical protein